MDNLITFLGVGASLYTIALVYGKIAKTSLISETVRCTFCRKEISAKVSKRTSTSAHRLLRALSSPSAGETLSYVYFVGGWKGR